MTPASIVHEVSVTILLTAILIVIMLALAFVVVLFVVRFDAPTWVAYVVIWALWGTMFEFFAVLSLLNGRDAIGMVVYGGAGGLCYHEAFEAWRKNRPRRRRSPARAWGRVVDLGGRLGITQR